MTLGCLLNFSVPQFSWLKKACRSHHIYLRSRWVSTLAEHLKFHLGTFNKSWYAGCILGQLNQNFWVLVLGQEKKNFFFKAFQIILMCQCYRDFVGVKWEHIGKRLPVVPGIELYTLVGVVGSIIQAWVVVRKGFLEEGVVELWNEGREKLTRRKRTGCISAGVWS